MTITIRTFDQADIDRVVELSLTAREPVFASFHAILGDPLYRRVHPDWRTDQAAAVRDALQRNDTWVAVAGGDPGHAPARATYEKAGFTGAPQVWYAKVLDPATDQGGSTPRPMSDR